MNFPFTREQFLDVFKDYNLNVWPMQVILLILALVMIFVSIKRNKYSDRIITFGLSFLWLWIGIGYHLMFFSRINKAAYFFAVLFIIQAILFFYYGSIKNDLEFNYMNNLKGVIVILFFLYALIVYPLLGFQLRHYYPRTPTFGLPCPTTIFTFGILLTLEKPIKVLFTIPMLWAIIGFTAALKLGIYEDIGLLISAVLTIGSLSLFNK